MTKRFKTVLMVSSAAALMLMSCEKEGAIGNEAMLSFSSNVPEIFGVKATAVTSVTDFKTKGYTGTDQWFPDPTSGTDPANVIIPDSGSQTFSTYKWEKDETKTFFAYSNNLPTTATATIANSGITLKYSAIPTEAADQNDVTLGFYSGDGNGTGNACLKFYHPLTQVVFKMGEMAGISEIKKISLTGLYNAGTTSLTSSTITDGTANFSWTGRSGTATVSQAVGSLPETGAEIGIPFMLIPQSLSTKNVTISIFVTLTNEGSSIVCYQKKLNSGSFDIGKKNVCTLNFTSREFGCNLTAYSLSEDDNIF